MLNMILYYDPTPINLIKSINLCRSLCGT